MFKQEFRGILILIAIALVALLASLAIIVANLPSFFSKFLTFTEDFSLSEFFVFGAFAILLTLILIFFRRSMRSSQEFREIADLTSSISEDVFVLTDKSERIEFITSSIERTFGFKAANYIGKPIHDLFEPDESFSYKPFFDLDSKPNYIKKYGRAVRANGEQIVLEITKAVSRTTGRRVFLLKDITGRIEMDREISLYQGKLRALWSQMSLAEERERQRISADLHDEIGQYLALSKIKLGALASSVKDNGLKKEIGTIRSLIDQSILYSRSLMFALNKPILSEIGLSEAILSLCESYQSSHAFLCSFEDDGQPKPLSNELSMVIYQSARELLVNVKKHAAAEKASVRFFREGDFAVLEVSDDGKGFAFKDDKISRANSKGFGLFSISERVEYYSGKIQIEASKGTGTVVRIAVPIQINEG